MMQPPRKRFGQHFLHDQSVIQRIIAALKLQPADHLVEIGPGRGALTFPLLKLGMELAVIEFDRDLVTFLQEYAALHPALRVYAQDVLDFDFAQLKADARLLKIVGNLPYNISTPLVFHLLTFTPLIAEMVFMFQKEVAERLSAAVDSEFYGRLSVMVQYACKVEMLFCVEADAFSPPPKVRSAVIRLIPHKSPPFVARDKLLFSDIVKLAFGQRRKTLRNSLKSLASDSLWQLFPQFAKQRPEQLSVADFVALSNALGASCTARAAE